MLRSVEAHSGMGIRGQIALGKLAIKWLIFFVFVVEFCGRLVFRVLE
jgi:hypothetical protein